MFISKRRIKGKQYFYLEDRINGKRASVFLGNTAKENLTLSGVKMLFAGIVIIIIILLLGIKIV